MYIIITYLGYTPIVIGNPLHDVNSSVGNRYTNAHI